MTHFERTSVGAKTSPLFAMLFLVACGGGDGEDDGGTGPTNRAPSANAGADQMVAELTTVDLSGSGSDPDGDALTYGWTQTLGTAVTLASPSSANTSFTAPDVPAGNGELLQFQLTVTDPSGASSNDIVSVTVQEPAATVNISGVLQYEFVPARLSCQGLDFSAITLRPIRQAEVQLLDETGTTILDSDISDDLGRYDVTTTASTNVMVRVRASSRRGGSPSWDFEVRNNVDTSGSPPPMEDRPIYAMDSSVFDSGVTDQMLDLTATTGWGGSSYTGPRVAAPFAVLDAIYTATLFIVATDSNVNLPALDAFWSPDNKTASPTDLDAGDLPTSFYGGNQRLYLLGNAGIDTEEFDDHIVIHEWGHYFEDVLSRSDSIGGTHFVTSGAADILDKRVAFGEGFASAIAGMALNDPIYCDTGGFNSGFGINLETRNAGTDGWFNEVSVIQLLYDLWDTNNDNADTGSIGFGPIYDVMTGPQASTEAFTSVFSFATYLKQQGTGQNALIDALLAQHDIETAGLDIYGTTETNDAAADIAPTVPEDVFPLYTDLTFGVAERICVNAQFDGNDRIGNKLAQRRYLRFSVTTPRSLSFTMDTVNPPATPPMGFNCVTDPTASEYSDPNFRVWRQGGLFVLGDECDPNSETENPVGLFPTGDYLVDLYDERYRDDNTPASFPSQMCFDFTVN